MENTEAPTTSETLLRALADWQNVEAWAAFLSGYVPFIDVCIRPAGLHDADAIEVRSRILASLQAAIRSLRNDSPRQFRGYIRICVRNAIISFYRELNTRDGLKGEGGEFSGIGVKSEQLSQEFEELASELERRTYEDLELLWRIYDTAKARLASTTWLSFELTRLKELSPQEAANQLNITVAKLYVFRGRVFETLQSIAREYGLVDD